MLPLKQFENHALQRGKTIAIKTLDHSISYAQLNQQANALADFLVHMGIQPGDRIALCLERSSVALISILGILKARACYVPIDPTYPQSWQQKILNHCQPHLLLGKTVNDLAVKSLELEQLQTIFAQATVDFESSVQAEDLCYLIYTSGTSGEPKGVMVSHANLGRLFPALSPHIDFVSQDVWCHMHSLSFGFSVWEVWGAFWHGATLFLPETQALHQAARLTAQLQQHQVNILSLTPSALRYLLHQWQQTPIDLQLPDLRYLAFSGEAIDAHVLQRWYQLSQLSQVRLINLYALTEASGQVAFYELTQQDAAADALPIIGQPLADTEFLLLNESQNRIQLSAQVGELYLAGPSIAQGYFNQAELTAERFLFLPEISPQRLYRTGDLVYQNARADYVFAGRQDRQLKLRGYRIEPAMVESALCQHPEIQDAIVCKESLDEQEFWLAAYLICTDQALPANLSSYLSYLLPHYAIPEKFYLISHIPLTPNGKLDVHALEQIKLKNQKLDPGNVSAKDTLTSAWTDVLALAAEQSPTHFFEQGGTSLRAMKLMQALEHEGIDIFLKDIFENPRFEGLLELVQQRQTSHKDARNNSECHDVEHQRWMDVAIEQARLAIQAQQVPYGCCIVRDGQLIAAGYNQIRQFTDITAHAEIQTLRQACQQLGRIDLSDCILYSTAEPCSMCFSAAIWAKIPTIVFAVSMQDEAKWGFSEATVPCQEMLKHLRQPVHVIANCRHQEMLTVFEDWFHQR